MCTVYVYDNIHDYFNHRNVVKVEEFRNVHHAEMVCAEYIANGKYACCEEYETYSTADVETEARRITRRYSKEIKSWRADSYGSVGVSIVSFTSIIEAYEEYHDGDIW